MTVIAWDGKTLAADKRAVNCGLVRTVTKIKRIGKLLVGVSGNTAGMAEAFRWIEMGCPYDKYSDILKDRNDGPSIMVIDAGRIILYGTSPLPTEYEDKIFASGSGRDFALTAMHLGKTAREAVEVACLFENGCGNGVDELTLDGEAE